jgi:hypothetical protein
MAGLVPATHAFLRGKTWMAVTSTAMTIYLERKLARVSRAYCAMKPAIFQLAPSLT